ncbi:MAG: Cytochrome c in methylamine utilization cluster [Hydrocarboniphaga sp.]|uniref:c-type cytochrome n=1 Tax=Hydrocarboniphaga sp. TaxID=2033016 RepID=UPI0026097C12|nr:cytochrome c [Hydrocarboniphaga sp.]MDB5970927.1 Cytochrome c in methylamine utilization cluster [Hydrocarboniphaga sp.]
MSVFPGFARATVVVALLSIATASSASEGETLYALNCSGCHGRDARGMPPQIPDLRASLPLLLSTAAGRGYALRVPGVAMSIATQQQVRTILNWMLPALIPGGERYTPFTLAEVATARRSPLTDPESARALLLDDGYGDPR